MHAWTLVRLRAKFNVNDCEWIFVWLWKLFEFGIFFAQIASSECWWDWRRFSWRVFGRWRRRSGVSCWWVCEHAMWVCFRAMLVILYTLCSWRKRVKPLRNYKIGMVMLFFLANCILKEEIAEVPFTSSKQKENRGSQPYCLH